MAQYDDLPAGAQVIPTASPYAKPGPYTTALPAQQEAGFQSWVKQNKIPWQDSPTADYDMRGYYKAQQAGDPNAKQAGNMHFPDTYKTPYHATFSNESQYATPDAPRWNGNRLIDKKGNVIADETPQSGDSSFSDLPSGAQVLTSSRPTIPQQNLDQTGLPPLNSQWDATAYGLSQAAGGVGDVLAGIGKMAFQPPQSKLENYLMAVPGGVQMKRILQSTLSGLSGITKVPGAIQDLANSDYGAEALAAVAPRAGGQGAATLGLAKIPDMINAIPTRGNAAANLQAASAKVGSLPIDPNPAGNAAFSVQDLAQSGGQMPKVVRDFIKRVTDPTQTPLTYDEARKFYSNASRLSSNEFQKLTPAMQREVGGFTRALGDSIQDTANQGGAGAEHAAGMSEYRSASQLSSALKSGAKYGVTALGGGYLAHKILGTGR